MENVNCGSDNMINDDICKLRDELNDSIVQGKDYSEIYRISVELDQLIAKYYRTSSEEKKKTWEKRQKKSKILAMYI